MVAIFPDLRPPQARFGSDDVFLLALYSMGAARFQTIPFIQPVVNGTFALSIPSALH